MFVRPIVVIVVVLSGGAIMNNKHYFSGLFLGTAYLMFSSNAFAQDDTGALVTARVVTPYDGYVMTHEHPTQAMSFGGNYGFVGPASNFRNGVMQSIPPTACGGCPPDNDNCDHGEFHGEISEIGEIGDIFIGEFSDLFFSLPLNVVGADIGAHDSFRIPKQKSFSHIRYSTDWIRDAFNPPETALRDSRMRILVAYAMDNEAMCQQLYESNLGNGGGTGEGYDCAKGDSFQSLNRQITNIKNWVSANASWMGVAENAEEARELMLQDKLVVIIGIEADYAFGAEGSEFDPVERLEHYYDRGVRTFYLAHKINSRLSGADIFKSPSSMPGKTIRAVQAISGCFYYDDNVGTFPLINRKGKNLCENDCGDGYLKDPWGTSLHEMFPEIFDDGPSINILWNPVEGTRETIESLKDSWRVVRKSWRNPIKGVTGQCYGSFGELPETSLATKALLHGSNSHNGFAIYPLPPGFSSPSRAGLTPTSADYLSNNGYDSNYSIERNNLGLSRDGKRVIRRAMELGMLVNLDHVSTVARTQIREISDEFKQYPLNAFHNNPNEYMVNSSKNTFEPSEYDFDEEERDMIRDTGGFFGVRLGPIDAVESGAPNYFRSEIINIPDCPGTSIENAKILGKLLDENLSIGYSLDFATVTQGTISRTRANCSTNIGPDRLKSYSERGTRSRYNTDGLVHIGMMKKWHKELETIGLKPEYLNKLKYEGSPNFLNMWQRSEDRSRYRCDSYGENCSIVKDFVNQVPKPIERIEIKGPAIRHQCQNDIDCGPGQMCREITSLNPKITRKQCVKVPELENPPNTPKRIR